MIIINSIDTFREFAKLSPRTGFMGMVSPAMPGSVFDNEWNYDYLPFPDDMAAKLEPYTGQTVTPAELYQITGVNIPASICPAWIVNAD